MRAGDHAPEPPSRALQAAGSVAHFPEQLGSCLQCPGTAAEREEHDREGTVCAGRLQQRQETSPRLYTRAAHPRTLSTFFRLLGTLLRCLPLLSALLWNAYETCGCAAWQDELGCQASASSSRAGRTTRHMGSPALAAASCPLYHLLVALSALLYTLRSSSRLVCARPRVVSRKCVIRATHDARADACFAAPTSCLRSS